MTNPLILDAAHVVPGRVPALDAHLHTDWTDGALSIEEVHREAVARGLEAILFSEHARAASADWFPDFAARVRALPRAPCRAFVGVECRIKDFQGTLDTVPAITDQCDLVMASVHRFPDPRGDALAFDAMPFDGLHPADAVDMEFRLSMAAIDRSGAHILGHPFGMTYSRFHTEPSDDLLSRLAGAAAEKGMAMEVNSHYHPQPWRLIELCREAGARIVLGSNAHGRDDIGAIVRLLRESEPA